MSITIDNNCLFSSIFIDKKHLSLLPIPVSTEKLGLPQDEESIFDILSKKKILDEKLCARAKEMKVFRNILIHRYADVDNELVYHNLKDHLTDFYDFEGTVKA